MVTAAADILVMIGIPALLYILNRFFPEKVKKHRKTVLVILSTWFALTFFGSRIWHGENIIVVAAALITAGLATAMYLVFGKYPEFTRKHETWFRVGFMFSGLMSMVLVWRFL